MGTTGSLKDKIDTISGLQLDVPQGPEAARLHEGDQPVADNEDMFNQQKQLRLDRQRQRAEIEATKKQKERSAGELALLFMGINQVAFELLIENPMTGYMNEIIFSRILGNDDIEQGAFWCDTTICYICARWQKQVISVDPRVDNPKWANKIKMINRVETTVDKLSNQAIEAERAKIRAEREAEKQAKLKGVTFNSGSETSHRR